MLILVIKVSIWLPILVLQINWAYNSTNYGKNGWILFRIMHSSLHLSNIGKCYDVTTFRNFSWLFFLLTEYHIYLHIIYLWYTYILTYLLKSDTKKKYLTFKKLLQNLFNFSIIGHFSKKRSCKLNQIANLCFIEVVNDHS